MVGAMTVLSKCLDPSLNDTLVACCASFGYMMPYVAGKYPPHYPVPALTDNAETATNWLHLVLCPYVYSDKYRQGSRPVPCPVCIDRFLDGLE